MIMQMSTEETETDDRLDTTLDNSASPSRDYDVTTTSATATVQTVVTFRVKVSLLFFAFNSKQSYDCN